MVKTFVCLSSLVDYELLVGRNDPLHLYPQPAPSTVPGTKQVLRKGLLNIVKYK